MSKSTLSDLYINYKKDKNPIVKCRLFVAQTNTTQMTYSKVNS